MHFHFSNQIIGLGHSNGIILHRFTGIILHHFISGLFFLTCRKDNAGVAPHFIYLSAAAQRSTLGYHLKSSTVPGLDASWMNELSSEKRSKGADPNGFYPWFTKVDGRVLTPLFIFHSSSLGSILFQLEHFFIGHCMIKPLRILELHIIYNRRTANQTTRNTFVRTDFLLTQMSSMHLGSRWAKTRNSLCHLFGQKRSKINFAKNPQN